MFYEAVWVLEAHFTERFVLFQRLPRELVDE